MKQIYFQWCHIIRKSNTKKNFYTVYNINKYSEVNSLKKEINDLIVKKSKNSRRIKSSRFAHKEINNRKKFIWNRAKL